MLKKKILSVAASLGSLYFLTASAAYAALPTIMVENPNVGFKDIGEIVQVLVNWAAALGAVATLIYIIVGAFSYITAGDDVKKTAGARQTITNGVIGLVIVASAFAIFQLLIRIIPGLQQIFVNQ